MRLQYRPILDLAIIPAVVFFLLSFVTVVLSTHYWILGDYFIPRGVHIPLSTINERTKRPDTDDTIVYFIDRVMDATISSGVLCLSAAVMSIIAWVTLRKPDMDSQYSAGKRRFYIIAVVVLTMTGAVTALASLILHFTKIGSNEFGCNSERLMMAGKMNSNQYCTREMAACNFQPRYLAGSDKSIAALACNEIIAVKWLQILLMLNAAIVFAFFALQARLRRSTRAFRSVDVPKDL